ncbi:type 1 fimbria pilin [Paraburkholderia sp. BL8N3]|nr:fimbrial protein [Paraburkholderia sp. BL8N3]TCK38472.1 type 1 fimbria pilin [Paraburkholderia sp. BL8N3]
MKTSGNGNISRVLVRALMLFILAFGWSAAARAECPATGLPATFMYGGSIAVTTSLTVGATIPETTRSFRLTGKCVSSGLFNKHIVACPQSQSPVPGMPGVYPTGMGGIGMRMRNSAGTPLDGVGECSTNSSLGMVGPTGLFDVSGTFELVKTGPVSTGTIGSAALFRVGVLNTGYLLNDDRATMGVDTSTALRAVTCFVTSDTANQSIPLMTVNSSKLASTGAVAARTPFSIGLTCDSGVRVNVTFSSVAGSSGVDSVVKSNGTATGVGIQLLDASDSPIVLDQSHNVVGSTAGNATVRFSAQYYRLSGGVTTGTVQASAIYTMSYQ